MARTFTVPEPYKSRGWKVKIRDRERVEPPHVTVLKGTNAWRFDLRKLGLMEPRRAPDGTQLPAELMQHLHVHADEYREEWDRQYPRNRVDSQETEEEGDSDDEGA